MNNTAVNLLRDLVGLAGLAGFVFGLYLVYPPLAYIGGGFVAFALAVISARANR